MVEVTDEIKEQLKAVQQTGRSNMLDVRGVQVIANDLELYALVIFCEDVLDLSQSARSKAWLDALNVSFQAFST